MLFLTATARKVSNTETSHGEVEAEFSGALHQNSLNLARAAKDQRGGIAIAAQCFWAADYPGGRIRLQRQDSASEQQG